MTWEPGFWTAAKPFITVASLILLWTLESWVPMLQRRHRWRHGWRNVQIAMINTLALLLLFGGLTVWLANWTQQRNLGLLNWLTDSPTVHLILALVTLDLWLYTWHRMNHLIPWLWRFHRMHHSDPEMDVTTATRFHLGEHLTGATLRLALVPMFGITLLELLVYETLVVSVTMLHHANISLGRYDRFLRWMIVTPGMHQIHHSRLRRETDSNYSVVLSIWDRLAGSYVHSHAGEHRSLGLDEFRDDRWQTVFGMLRTPWAEDHTSAVRHVEVQQATPEVEGSHFISEALPARVTVDPIER